MGLLTKAFTPLTNAPSRAGKKAANAIDTPRMPNESLSGTPLEGYGNLSNKLGAMGRGFLSGAVQGAGDLVSDMTSPVGIGSTLLNGGAGLLARALKSAAPIARAAGPTMDLIESAPAVKQVMPAADDVTSLIGDLQRNLARIPNAGARAVPQGINPAMLPPEMAAIGQEAAVNAPRILQAQKFAEGVENVADTAARMSGKRRPFLNVPRDPRSVMAR